MAWVKPLGDAPRPPLAEVHGKMTLRQSLHPVQPWKDRTIPDCTLHPDRDVFYVYHPCDCDRTYCRHADWTEYICPECGASTTG